MSYAADYRSKLVRALAQIDLEKVEQATQLLAQARDAGRTVFVCGNGGSAATANHFACDVVKGASYGREKRFRIMALSESIPTLTAYSNDVGYESVFVEQLENFAKPGDVFLAISGSGNSANVVKAMERANEIGCETIALTGFSGGRLGPLAKLHLHVPENHMGRSEDAHMVMLHMICYRFMEEPV